MKQERRSAKQIIEDYAQELRSRPESEEREIKLSVIKTIAHRMGWTELYQKLHFRKGVERRQPWWTE